MSSGKNSIWKRLTKSQWSYFYAGLAFGLAQIIYVVAVWGHKIIEGKVPNQEPISVTTDLGRMFRSLEVFFNHLFGFQSELYGTYTKVGAEAISGGGVFTPGIGWPIVGMILGGLIVSIMEKETRAWAYYSKKALVVSFIGGAFFSYGTRLAGGCTLTHLMGGVPTMGIRSTFSIMFMALGGMTGFIIMEKLGLANYFKHQETKAYVANADIGEQATLKKGYNFRKNPVFWVSLLFTVLFVVVAVGSAVGNPFFMQNVDPEGAVHAYTGSVWDKSLFFVTLTLVSGLVAGIALAKSGFGTECSLVSMETASSMRDHDAKYAKMGVPRITRTLMRSYTPMIGVTTSWVVLTAFFLLAWVLTGVSPALGYGVKKGLTAGNFIGGFLLGMGAVTLIGCEIRSYMRLGMGYLNTLVGFMGFAVGYLPYTLFPEEHLYFLQVTTIFGEGGFIAEPKEWYSLITENIGMQQFVMLIWLQLLILFLIWLIKKGSRNIGLSTKDIMHKNTEDIQITIEEVSSGQSSINGVSVPQRVPEEALP